MKTQIEDLQASLQRHAGVMDVSAATVAARRTALAEKGFVVLTDCFPRDVIEAVGDEARRLIETAAVRRDLSMPETDHTPRRMWNVRRDDIWSRGLILRSLYEMPIMRELLTAATGEAVFACPFGPEQCVITCLQGKGDTHGWHWDDYAYALVWIIERPGTDGGGLVQCVPRTQWNKQAPRVGDILKCNRAYSFGLTEGSLYFMKTDTTLHRVSPLIRSHRRIAVNMAWASDSNLRQSITHETVDLLWSR